MSENQAGWCGHCQEGDHQYHKPHLAGICIGCACDWTPDDEEEE